MRLIDTSRWLASIGRLSRGYLDPADVPGGHTFFRRHVGIQWYRDTDMGRVFGVAVSGLFYLIIARGNELSHFKGSRYKDMRLADALPAIYRDGYRQGRLDTALHLTVVFWLITVIVHVLRALL